MSAPRRSAEGFRLISNRLFLEHRPRRDRRVQKGQFTAIEAFLSMHMDLHHHRRLLSERSYARLWGRSRKWARARMDEFRADAVYQQQGDQLGVQLGDHVGDQDGDHLSRTTTAGSMTSGDQLGDHSGDQRGDQTGTTTQRREETEKRERGNGADAPLSALSDVVLRERPEWDEHQREVWLRDNLQRIKDTVDAQRPRDRSAAIRATVRSWARREKNTPCEARRVQPRTTRERVLAHMRNAHPEQESFTEGHIRAHWRQFEQQCQWGPYVAPEPDSET